MRAEIGRRAVGPRASSRDRGRSRLIWLRRGWNALALLLATLLGLAGCLLSVPAVAHACSLDSRPSAYADGQRDRLNTQAPTTAAQLAGWAPFVFARSYPVRRAVVLTEDRREVARSLTAAAMRRPWRWRFGDGHVAYGWTVRHTYAHPGHWRISVDAYDPGTRQWYNFDQVLITISAGPRHAHVQR